MGKSAVQFRIMPENLDTNLSEILEECKKIIEEMEGVFSSSEEQPIAFGLKALIVTFALSEDQEVDEVENAIHDLEGVSSVELIDYRRAVG